jgi:hypothetical protein
MDAIRLDSTNLDVVLTRGAANVLQLGSGDQLAFGGVTASEILLQRNATQLEVKLGDNSGFASFGCAAIAANGVITASASVATPAGGSTSARLLLGTTAGFGIYYGSGAPTVSAAQGSIYIRSNGTTTNDRFYINTNGSTTWTAVTTAA